MKKSYEYKAIGFVVVLLVAAIIVYTHQQETPLPKENSDNSAALTLHTQNIQEENFTGTMPIISGSSLLAVSAREYIEQKIADFRAQANNDVPDMRATFGPTSPTAQYTIDIEAKHIQGSQTESLVISMYTYTGGANGNSSYKVITSSFPDGKILFLSDVIKPDQHIAFTNLVKKKLNEWRPYGSDGPVVFADEVKDLTFDSFANWSLDDQNLTIYFDKYEVGPGALGAVAFPLPRNTINELLNL